MENNGPMRSHWGGTDCLDPDATTETDRVRSFVPLHVTGWTMRPAPRHTIFSFFTPHFFHSLPQKPQKNTRACALEGLFSPCRSSLLSIEERPRSWLYPLVHAHVRTHGVSLIHPPNHLNWGVKKQEKAEELFCLWLSAYHCPGYTSSYQVLQT